jgi:hypothetical protein
MVGYSNDIIVYLIASQQKRGEKLKFTLFHSERMILLFSQSVSIIFLSILNNFTFALKSNYGQNRFYSYISVVIYNCSVVIQIINSHFINRFECDRNEYN